MRIEPTNGRTSLLLGLLLSLTACAGADPDQTPDGRSAEAEVESTEQPIFSVVNPGSTRSKERGAVQICFQVTGGTCCSGSLLNNGVVMTAAHCLPVPNRNRSYPVSISYEPPRDPNAPFCLPEECPEVRSWNFNMFFYHHPNQTQGDKNNILPPYDIALGAICASSAASCFGGSVTSFNLDSKHFVTLSNTFVGDGKIMTLLAYGGPEVGRQHKLEMRISEGGTRTVYYNPRALGYYTCDGDSGGPLLRSSGHTDSMGSYWNAQAVVHHGARPLSSGNSSNTFFDTPTRRISCADRQTGSVVFEHINWIQDISTFWTTKRCVAAVTPSGENVRKCF